MGKYTERKKRPIITMIGTGEKKKEMFKHVHKLRRSADNMTSSHDLTTKGLYELIKEAKNKEESGKFSYRVCGPTWGWYVKKIVKFS